MTRGLRRTNPDIAFAFTSGLICLLLLQSPIFDHYCSGTFRFGDLAVFRYLPVATWMLVGMQTALVMPAVAVWVFRTDRAIAMPALGQALLILFQIGIEAVFAHGGEIYRIAVVGAVFSTWRTLRLIQIGTLAGRVSPTWRWIFYACAVQWAVNLAFLLTVLGRNCATP